MIYLYIKTHNRTGLKYFGKTTRKDPHSYSGSGKHWKRHLTIHGEDFSTEIVGKFEDEKQCTEFAIQFSKEHDIVESKEWANLIEENGLDGAPIGNIVKQHVKDKISKALMGKANPKSKYEIKEDKQIRAQRCREITIDTIWVNNGVEEKRVKEIPKDWCIGRLKNNKIGDTTLGSKNLSGNNTRGKVIYNDGISHRYYTEGTQPEGWVRGKMQGYQGGTGAHKKGKKYDKNKK